MQQHRVQEIKLKRKSKKMKLDLQRIKWSSKECNCFCFPNSNLLILWFKQIDLSKLIENDSPKTSILFFLDIAFRHDYPNKPLMVTCRSHELFLNPCFYPHCKILFESVACWSKWRAEPFCIDDSSGSNFTPGVVLNERPLNNTPMTVKEGDYWKNFNEASAKLCLT